jgi:hypothetical protein
MCCLGIYLEWSKRMVRTGAGIHTITGRSVIIRDNLPYIGYPGQELKVFLLMSQAGGDQPLTSALL